MKEIVNEIFRFCGQRKAAGRKRKNGGRTSAATPAPARSFSRLHPPKNMTAYLDEDNGSF